jgi:hypothetical protein
MTKIWNNANKALSTVPSIPIQGLGSLQIMLRIPRTTPIALGKTNNNALSSFSVDKDKPDSADSNSVRRIRKTTDNPNKAIDLAPSLNFISHESSKKIRFYPRTSFHNSSLPFCPSASMGIPGSSFASNSGGG